MWMQDLDGKKIEFMTILVCVSSRTKVYKCIPICCSPFHCAIFNWCFRTHRNTKFDYQTPDLFMVSLLAMCMHSNCIDANCESVRKMPVQMKTEIEKNPFNKKDPAPCSIVNFMLWYLSFSSGPVSRFLGAFLSIIGIGFRFETPKPPNERPHLYKRTISMRFMSTNFIFCGTCNVHKKRSHFLNPKPVSIDNNNSNNTKCEQSNFSVSFPGDSVHCVCQRNQSTPFSLARLKWPACKMNARGK